MAKKDGSSPKKSAAPYTPEVVPGDAAPVKKKAAKPAAKSRKASTDQNPPQMAQEMPAAAKPKAKPAAAPVMAEVKPPEIAPTAMASRPEIEAPVASVVEMENALSSAAAETAAPAASKVITWDMINERAYFISISGYGGSQDDNWHKAEYELKREAGLI